MAVYTLKGTEKIVELAIKAIILYDETDADEYTSSVNNKNGYCYITMHMPVSKELFNIECIKDCYKAAINKAKELGYQKVAVSLVYCKDFINNSNHERMEELMKYFYAACYELEDKDVIIDIYLILTPAMMNLIPNLQELGNISNQVNAASRPRIENNSNNECFRSLFVSITNDDLLNDSDIPADVRSRIRKLDPRTTKEVINEWIDYINNKDPYDWSTKLKKKDVKEKLKGCMNEKTCDKIFAGEKTSKEHLVLMAMALGMDVEHAKELLYAGDEVLSKRIAIDLVYRDFITRGKDPFDLKEFLAKYKANRVIE